MTGFGSAEGPVGEGRLQVDVRSVNHRHLNVQLKLPASLQEVEAHLRDVVRKRVQRGHVTLAVRWTEEAPRDAGISVNVDRAREVVSAMAELKRALDLDGEIDVGFVARQPEVLAFSAGEVPSVETDDVTKVVTAALDALVAVRNKEGAALAQELERLLAALETALAAVEGLAPARITAERDRLQRAVAELLNGNRLDENRLAQEIALLADKLDITEEIVRLRTHLDAARDALARHDAIGKQLSFLSQEMLREVNTIGSKANNADIAQHVIAMKGELERFREQIENLE